MAPNAENTPALGAKEPGCATVAGAVAGDFVLPIFAVSLGHAAVPTATVPEAAVHEDGYALAPENKVGMAWEWLVPPPATDAGSAQDGHQSQLGVFVAARVYRGHDLRALTL